MNSSMMIHRVKSITAKVEPLDCYGNVSSTTRLVITSADGNQLIVTCFSDQPVAVEEAPIKTTSPAPVEEEVVPT